MTEEKKLLRYFANCSKEVQLEVIKKQTELIRKNRDKIKYYSSREEFLREQLLKAIQKIKFLEQEALHRKITEEDLEKVHEIRTKQIKTRKKRKPEKELKIRKKYFYLIKELLENQKLSWRQISQYLAKYHKFKVTHGYIQQIYNKILNELDESEKE